jgi:hypothetical protein
MVTNFKLYIVSMLENHHPIEDIKTKEVYSNVQGMRLSQNKRSPKAKGGGGNRGALILAMPHSKGVTMCETWAEFYKKNFP